MRIVYFLLFLLLCAPPLYAEQALVLTEIEQLQEKIWFLQRDLAAAKTSIKTQQEGLGKLQSATTETSAQLTKRLVMVEESTLRLQDSLQQFESQLSQLNESHFELSENLGQKDNTILDMAGKAGALDGSIQALRKELASQQDRHEKALLELRNQLSETRTQLTALQHNGFRIPGQLSLWIGGAVLGLAVLLTVILSLRGSSRKRRKETRKEPPKYEM